MKLEIVLEQEDDGTYSVHCPALKGCHSQGDTREDALINIREAIQLYLEVANEKARDIIGQHPKSIAIERLYDRKEIVACIRNANGESV